MLIPIDTNKTAKLEAVWTKLISPFLESVKRVYNITVSGSVATGSSSNAMKLKLDFKSEYSKNFVSPLLQDYLKYSTGVMDGIEMVKVYETESTTEVELILLESRYELILSVRDKTSPFCYVFPIDPEGAACKIPREGGDFPFSVIASAETTATWSVLSSGVGVSARQVGASEIEPTLDVNKAKRKANYIIPVPENTTGAPRVVKLQVRTSSGSITRNIEIKQL